MGQIKAEEIASVAIFPPIGIARVGNSEDPEGWFYGPEVPGRHDYLHKDFKFKDNEHKIKRQAARFRVYGYDKDNKVLGELTKEDGFTLTWTVEVANKKASWYTFQGRLQEGAFKPGYTTLRNPNVQPEEGPNNRTDLIVAPKAQSIALEKLEDHSSQKPVPLNGFFKGSTPIAQQIYLGELRTDEKGRLVFLAGRGRSLSIADPNEPFPEIMTDFDSSNWIDDTCDGTVNVQVSHQGGQKTWQPKELSHVIGTTPKFATDIYAPTTLYDLIENIYVKEFKLKEETKVTFYEHIWPLLQRPPLLSWVNGQADGGHGPNAQGNFFTEDWRRALKSKDEKDKASRMIVLGRMRLPDIPKYSESRNGQAFPYFMPWLSGDGGRTTAGDISTFTSVTELQFERLQKWANGDFELGTEPTFYEKLEDMDPSLQPEALTRAHLEWTIGAPLYPGIEMSWNAEEKETYNPNVWFRIASTQKPGDLTKYLSLPWQSDFYMCRSYWWPSVRPDAVLTVDEFNKVVKSNPDNLSKALTNRVPWERGLRVNYTDEYSDQPLFANTDMARNWDKLGFIVKHKEETGNDLPIYYEVERGKITRDGIQKHQPRAFISSGVPPSPFSIGLPKPHSLRFIKMNQRESQIDDSPIKTLESLKEHLQTAIFVELSTIPLYLYAMYSIKPPKEFENDARYYNPTVGDFRGIIAEEMLHLSLAGNTLLAIGGQPKLYDKQRAPKYPMYMTGRVPPLQLNLAGATKEQLKTLMAVELPQDSDDDKPQADEYNTLGQFYEAIELGLEYLHRSDPNLFHQDSIPKQFSPGNGYQPRVPDAGGSVVVKDLDSAKEALQTIIRQGEGTKHRETDDPSDQEMAHYYIFKKLSEQCDSAWSVYPVKVNPTLEDYKRIDERIYQVALVFDAAYSYLLVTIETLWTIGPDDARRKLVLGNMFGIMMGVLLPLAQFLVRQPLSDTEVAGPIFGFYEFKERPSKFQQLRYEMKTAINSYINVTAETPDQVTKTDYGAQIERLLPIQNSIEKLFDLDSVEFSQGQPCKKPSAAVHSSGHKGFAKGF